MTLERNCFANCVALDVESTLGSFCESELILAASPLSSKLPDEVLLKSFWLLLVGNTSDLRCLSGDFISVVLNRVLERNCSTNSAAFETDCVESFSEIALRAAPTPFV